MRGLRIAALLLLLTPALAAPAPDTSLTIRQYVEELQQLRQAVKTQSDVSQMVQQLPSQWTIGANGQDFTVNTTGITQAFRAYAKEPTAAHRDTLTSRLDLLLADARAMQSEKADITPERAKLSEILSRHEFRNIRGETWYERWQRAIQRWLARMLEHMLFSSAFPVVSRVVIWGLLAVAVAVAAYWIVRTYRQQNIYTKFTGAPEAISAKPWRDWQSEAQAAAQEGRWRDAVHLLYWAGISFLEAQGLWRPDRARTPREYLSLLPETDAHRTSLRELTHSFEKVWYGTDAATADTFAGASALLERLGCR